MPRSLWFRRAALVMVAAVTVLTLSAAILEQTVRRKLPLRYPAPGKLVAVDGGRRIQIDCRGTGEQTVVLESGLDMYGSTSWSAVQDSIARTTRVCSYSRAGVMWSDPASGFGAEAAARDLHAALFAAGERSPWVMAGHSLGGAYVMTFTRLYGPEVSGIVMVDASHPDQFSHFRAATGRNLAPSDPAASIAASLAWTGLLRLVPAPPVPASWPREVSDVFPGYFPTSLVALVDEMTAAPRTLEESGVMRSLGSRPLIVLTAGNDPSPSDLEILGLSAAQGQRLEAVSRRLQADMATWSLRGRQRIVEGSGHYIQMDRPDAVIAAVREVVRESAITR